MAAIIGNRNITLGVMGGTLITAACYSGGEVFGCSPYDKATTRYLKATYPSYWQAIRNYGFANPQLVPWINEDNDLIVSLVGVGKERWLKGDRVAFIDTGIIGTLNTTIEARYNVYALSDTYLYANNRVSTRAITLYFNSAANERFGRLLVNPTMSELVGIHTVFQSKDFIKLDGIIKKTYGSQGDFTTDGTIHIFGGNTGSSMSDYKISDINFAYDGKHFVPCKNPNGSDYGMLDLVNLQWYGNANTSGAFTIEITDR